MFNPKVDSEEYLRGRYEKIKENNLNFESYLKSYFIFDVIIKPPKFKMLVFEKPHPEPEFPVIEGFDKQSFDKATYQERLEKIPQSLITSVKLPDKIYLYSH